METVMVRNMNLLVRFALGLGAFLLIAAATAQEQSDLEVVLEQHKIVADASGNEKSEAAKLTKPGDVIEYAVTYRNTSKSSAKNIAGTLPVPEGMEFTGKKSGPGAFLASQDGQIFKAPPLMRRVKVADARETYVEVPESEYKSLRWQLGDLAAGKSITVSAHMRLRPVIDPVAARMGRK
jgi:uncharacterized repeat protein (TIGR01451 family)